MKNCRVVLPHPAARRSGPFPGRLFCTLMLREVVTCPMKRTSFRSTNERRANRERSPRRAALPPARLAAASAPCGRPPTTT
nr:MAG TPA: hypothetical protein [Caudoviricetes sp.]